ncbi:hypothetical protein SAMD00019534_006420 [Acytostelium subglobosum LB1]|uniref:hypothetical protein n=1 Tax=Acytostelium subglobosum LB1 TaxID=1410327 RepID=UPI0006451F20|nr:hypothetical protein SAMD00019534_006420 [Acytostelium subglobosum LB1]GAM17467.1 hypothetical protein SAMD00019534_006420 [Acytostelium subglobosum LB1]|eukprot:XP_012759529.1 hypothetical protein SAMD00019534_006420 [Acytostelium subglobosum LB1]
MFNNKLVLSTVVVLCLFAGWTSAACTNGMATSISQYNITFTFDKAYKCGTFANGDYWVITNGSYVTIKTITPAFTGQYHGWQANPSSPSQQGFDKDIEGFNTALVPALPYKAAANTSVVKTISLLDANRCDGHYGCLLTAAVLTVLSQAPPANTFRPCYYGNVKKLYSANNLRTNLLPNLTIPADTPTVAYFANRYQRVQLDHYNSWAGQYLHPHLNMATYGADVASDSGDCGAFLTLNFPLTEKKKVLIPFLQAGLDYAGMLFAGVTWQADGGHMSGRKMPIALAAIMLNDSAIYNKVSTAPLNTFGEDGQVYWSTNASRALWGSAGCNFDDYWTNQLSTDHSDGQKDCRDPYGYIDGGVPADNYQMCCTSNTWKTTALTVRLIPTLQCAFNYDVFLQYVDRWVTFGAWTLPDPYTGRAPGGVVGTPSRYPSLHGTGADSGYYSSDFSASMWTTHRSSAPSITCPRAL